MVLLNSCRFGLSERSYKELLSIINNELGDPATHTAWVFGSRARGDHRCYSDLDLLLIPVVAANQSTRLISQSIEHKRVVGAMCERFEESSIPIVVDVVDFDDLAEDYRTRIMEEKVALTNGG